MSNEDSNDPTFALAGLFFVKACLTLLMNDIFV